MRTPLTAAFMATTKFVFVCFVGIVLLVCGILAHKYAELEHLDRKIEYRVATIKEHALFPTASLLVDKKLHALRTERKRLAVETERFRLMYIPGAD